MQVAINLIAKPVPEPGNLSSTIKLENLIQQLPYPLLGMPMPMSMPMPMHMPMQPMQHQQQHQHYAPFPHHQGQAPYGYQGQQQQQQQQQPIHDEGAPNQSQDVIAGITEGAADTDNETAEVGAEAEVEAETEVGAEADVAAEAEPVYSYSSGFVLGRVVCHGCGEAGHKKDGCETYKRTMCEYYDKLPRGCTRGDHCWYAHGAHELRQFHADGEMQRCVMVNRGTVPGEWKVSGCYGPHNHADCELRDHKDPASSSSSARTWCKICRVRDHWTNECPSYDESRYVM